MGNVAEGLGFRGRGVVNLTVGLGVKGVRDGAHGGVVGAGESLDAAPGVGLYAAEGLDVGERLVVEADVLAGRPEEARVGVDLGGGSVVEGRGMG